LEEAAQDLVGRSVFIGWPHLIEAFIVSVANDEIRFVDIVTSGWSGALRSVCLIITWSCVENN